MGQQSLPLIIMNSLIGLSYASLNTLLMLSWLPLWFHDSLLQGKYKLKDVTPSRALAGALVRPGMQGTGG